MTLKNKMQRENDAHFDVHLSFIFWYSFFYFHFYLKTPDNLIGFRVLALPIYFGIISIDRRIFARVVFHLQSVDQNMTGSLWLMRASLLLTTLSK